MILPTFDKWVRINDDGSISIVAGWKGLISEGDTLALLRQNSSRAVFEMCTGDNIFYRTP